MPLPPAFAAAASEYADFAAAASMSLPLFQPIDSAILRHAARLPSAAAAAPLLFHACRHGLPTPERFHDYLSIAILLTLSRFHLRPPVLMFLPLSADRSLYYAMPPARFFSQFIFAARRQRHHLIVDFHAAFCH